MHSDSAFRFAFLHDFRLAFDSHRLAEMGDEVDLMAHLEGKRREVAAMQEAANVAKEQALALLRLQRRVAEIDAIAYGDSGPPTAEPQVQTLSQSPSRSSEYAGSSLSLEDRRRFGLEDEKDASGVAASLSQREARTLCIKRSSSGVIASCSTADDGAAAVDHGSLQVSSPSRSGRPRSAPRWSSLSLDDRIRFGLDVDGYEEPVVVTSPAKRVSYQVTRAISPVSPSRRFVAYTHHPDVLWGRVRGDRDASWQPEPDYEYAPGSGALSMARTIAQLEAVGSTKLLADLKESERALQNLKLRG